MTVVSLDLSTMTMADLNKFINDAKTTVSANTRKTADKQITDLLSQARSLITQAENIADENGITFTFSLEYGMGGTYYPHGRENDHEWESSFEGWVSSSSQC
jgi:hypothetical protein